MPQRVVAVGLWLIVQPGVEMVQPSNVGVPIGIDMEPGAELLGSDGTLPLVVNPVQVIVPIFGNVKTAGVPTDAVATHLFPAGVMVVAQALPAIANAMIDANPMVPM